MKTTPLLPILLISKSSAAKTTALSCRDAAELAGASAVQAYGLK
eukprot:CAMPEP_0114301802 /NCGR_PEP_ID=MMETSP0059-20121206/14311_1 /TAXON_ID=36894 /ORGANISM="Pyramimonas parkeae, Strain CCMP726" /LENGTH=43 /DNA_ID= /DNA_START= /DNA_END= /DNA_ORIENTATION=